MTNIANTSTQQQFAVVQTGVASVTGDGTVYTAVYSSSLQGSGIVIGTGIFTCTVSGVFIFSLYAALQSLNSSVTTANYSLVTTSRTYLFANFSAGAFRSQAAVAGMGRVVIAPMSAGDTAYMTVQGSGTTKIVGFGNGTVVSASRLF